MGNIKMSYMRAIGWENISSLKNSSTLSDVKDLVMWMFLIYNEGDFINFLPKLMTVSYPLGRCLRFFLFNLFNTKT